MSRLSKAKAKWTHLETVEDIERELHALARQTSQIRDTDDPLVILVRGIILMERALHYMLDDYLVDGLKPFARYHPDFAFLTDLARAVGLITANEKAMIDAIGVRRNNVAHRIDVVVTKGDEDALAATFIEKGYSFGDKPDPIAVLILRALNPKAFDKGRPFYKLRYIIMFFVALLNGRNGERRVFKLEQHEPPNDENSVKSLQIYADFLMTGFSMMNASEEKSAAIIKRFAEAQLEFQRQRKATIETTTAPAAPKPTIAKPPLVKQPIPPLCVKLG